MHKFIVFSVCIVLSGCAGFIKTNEVSSGRAESVPDERLYAFQERAAGLTRITITRDSGFLGGGCYLAIEVDRKLAARIDPAESASFFVPAGYRELSVTSDPMGRGLCGAASFTPVRESYEITTDKVARYRLSLRRYRRPELEPLN